ncbi:o-succinylbenzoate--CoA ligase [Listeria booriae]|uniref:2-succinylbenzoate--CoA ligase n=1 Tax=Listeria booriae TaxID=1552123 RepID=A0A7X0XLE5_9LIST|nr:o-succinylbenzoate--CoA ligase [Listeria booriae]MBC1563214.1 o-succinylbenzoate--CoA ligase [Listeria booriae]
MELTNWLEKRVRLSPKRTALVFDGKQETFSEIYDAVQKVAGQLASFGVRDGMFVALLGKNDRDTFLMIHALQQLGAKTVFLNNRLTATEMGYQIRDARVERCLYAADFADVMANAAGNVRAVAFTEVMMVESSGVTQTVSHFAMETVASIMYTSGTTGKPKGVMQTFGNHWWSATGSMLNLGLQEGDSWLCAVPIFHISGLSILMRSVIYGIPVYLEEHFDAKRVDQFLCSGEVTIISVVTTMVQRLLDTYTKSYHPKFRCMLLGGGPASKAILESCFAKGIPLIQSFGMTETASQIVTLPPEDALQKIGASGKPLFPAEVKISDQDEILLKGPNITVGYLHNEAATQAAFDANGWFRTGDIGYLDQDGFLFVQERRSDLIISGGENIYPTEIEHVLLEYPTVLEVAVVAKQDDKWGEVPVAFLVTNEETSEEQLHQFCEERLAKYKIPHQFHFLKELPKTASQKIQRHKLKNL